MHDIRVAIAEDNSFALQVIRGKLQTAANMTLTVIASNGIDLLQKLRQSGRTDVVLMDIEMPAMDGIEATALIKKEMPQIKIIMLTIFDDDDKILESIQAGADGYILKEERGTKIIQCIHETLEGGAGMSAGIAGRVLKMLKLSQPAQVTYDDSLEKLTKRELEILTQLKEGLSYDRIAENLFISYGTVRKHIENVYRKLQVHNKVEAVTKGRERRLI